MADFIAITKRGQCLVIQADHAPRIFNQPQPILRQSGLPAIFGEERHIQTLFKPAHLHGNSRLRLMNGFARLGKTAKFGNCQERSKLIDIEHVMHGRPVARNLHQQR